MVKPQEITAAKFVLPRRHDPDKGPIGPGGIALLGDLLLNPLLHGLAELRVAFDLLHDAVVLVD